MVAGQGTPDQAPARLLAYRHPDAFARIIDVLVENSIIYLLEQLKAGADVLQIFDTWAGVLPPREFARWSVEPTRRIVEGVRERSARMPRSSAFPAAPARCCRAMSRRPASMPSASTGPPSQRWSVITCRTRSQCKAISIRWR